MPQLWNTAPTITCSGPWIAVTNAAHYGVRTAIRAYVKNDTNSYLFLNPTDTWTVACTTATCWPITTS
jgi:hypothetical protein